MLPERRAEATEENDTHGNVFIHQAEKREGVIGTDNDGRDARASHAMPIRIRMEEARPSMCVWSHSNQSKVDRTVHQEFAPPSRCTHADNRVQEQYQKQR